MGLPPRPFALTIPGQAVQGAGSPNLAVMRLIPAILQIIQQAAFTF